MSEREVLKNYKRIVIKVGTSSLTYESGRLNLRRINKLVWVLSDLKNQGKEVVLVSSGAVAVGVERLGLSERPKDIIGRQAASSVGQASLMRIYEQFFAEYNQKVAQILLTKDVIDDGVKRLNAENTFFRLLSLGIIPIVNENDAIATDELSFSFSENDTLSAYVAELTKSELLIMLSDIDGLYDSDPKINPDAKIIPLVKRVSEIEHFATGATSVFGSGGMISKLAAADMLAKSSIDTIIASGEDPAILFDIINGMEVGTYFIHYR